VLVQIVGLILERDDPKAFGDNIGGLLFFGAALVFVLTQRLRSRRLIERLAARSTDTRPSP
jgi:hypothetical protein